MISQYYSLISFYRLYAVCCVRPLPNFGLVFCDFISVIEFFNMFFCYFWGHDFFPASRDAVWRLALPTFKGGRDSNRNAFPETGWHLVLCCLSSQKRNRRAGVKLLSFQFNCFHFKCSIPTCFFLSFTFSLKHIIFFNKKSVNWFDTILLITTLSAHT